MPQENNFGREIMLVDDDPGVRKTLYGLLSHEGFTVTSFAEGASFLVEARKRIPACIILDVHMPGKSGLDILKELNAEDYQAPIIIMSGQADIPLAVDSIKSGAFDFVQKPIRGRDLVERIEEAIEAKHRHQVAEPIALSGRAALTPRESEVLARIIAGASNKTAAKELGISSRTIEVHRSRIMEKLGAKSAAELFHIVLRARTRQK